MFIYFTLSNTYKKHRVCFNGGGVISAYKPLNEAAAFHKRTARTTLFSQTECLSSVPFTGMIVSKCCYSDVIILLRITQANTRNKRIETQAKLCL